MRSLLRISFIPSLVAATVLVTGCADEAAPPSASARVATLDTVLMVDLSGLPTPTPASPVAVNHDRSLIAIGLRDGSGEIMVFDGEGELVRQFGREGQGPGEFREISLLTFAPGSDTLWVLGAGNRRASAWAPGATEPSREITLRGRYFGAAWASDTTLVVQGRFEDGESTDALGRAVHPGGVTPTLVEEGLGADGPFDQFMRPLTSSESGGVWVGHFREPRLRHLDSSLAETGAFDFHAPGLAYSFEPDELGEVTLILVRLGSREGS